MDSGTITPVQLAIQSSSGLEVEQPESELKKTSVRAEFIPLVNGNALQNQKEYMALLDGRAPVASTPKEKKLSKEEIIFMV